MLVDLGIPINGLKNLVAVAESYLSSLSLLNLK